MHSVVLRSNTLQTVVLQGTSEEGKFTKYVHEFHSRSRDGKPRLCLHWRKLIADWCNQHLKPDTVDAPPLQSREVAHA